MTESTHMAMDLVSGRVQHAISRVPLLANDRGKWRGLSLEHHAAREVDLREKAPLGHVVVLQHAGAAELEWRRGPGGFGARVVRAPGMISVLPAMAPMLFRTANLGEVVGVLIEPGFLAFAANDLAGPEPVELRPCLAVEDALLAALVAALRRDVAAGHPGGGLYAESLGTSIAVHLMRHYSTRPPAWRDTGKGLTRCQLRQAIEYIHENLTQDVSLPRIAEALQLSPFHFARLFKKSTGLAPHQYIIQKRVERARHLLQVADIPIVDVALKAGFADQSHLALHFRRVYKLSPRAFRKAAGLRLSREPL